LQGLPGGLKFIGVPSITDLSVDIFPALRLVLSSDDFQIVHQTDHGREFRRVGRRQEKSAMDDLLMVLNCEDVWWVLPVF